ncbi:MAG: hypothetical protein ACREMQ_05795 [Longimicrobiales bacterium]
MQQTARWFLAASIATLLTGCSEDAILAPLPEEVACPVGLPVPATCHGGEGTTGAAYIIAMPAQWNGTLVLFNRGATPVPFDSCS